MSKDNRQPLDVSDPGKAAAAVYVAARLFARVSGMNAENQWRAARREGVAYSEYAYLTAVDDADRMLQLETGARCQHKSPDASPDCDSPAFLCENHSYFDDVVGALTDAGNVPVNGIESVANGIRQLTAERDRMRALLAEVARSAVSHEGPQIGYLEIQIDRATWDALREFREEPKP